MDKINRLSWEATETFVAHGVRIGVRVQRGDVPTLEGLLPPGTERRRLRTVDRLYSIVGGRQPARRGVRAFTLLYGDSDLLARTVDPTEIVTALTDDLQLRVGELTPRRIFVHAGVVGWRGRAIVLPGASFCGKSTLVAALVRRGATYYSDEYALFDGRGRVWPFARPLSLRTGDGTSTRRFEPHTLGRVGAAPLPVGVVWLTKFSQGKRKQPESLSPGRAVLQTLAHTLTARRRPQAALTALSAAMQRATLLAGARGAADEAADWLMEECS
jgi:hypothetical protein